MYTRHSSWSTQSSNQEPTAKRCYISTDSESTEGLHHGIESEPGSSHRLSQDSTTDRDGVVQRSPNISYASSHASSHASVSSVDSRWTRSTSSQQETASHGASKFLNATQSNINGTSARPTFSGISLSPLSTASDVSPSSQQLPRRAHAQGTYATPQKTGNESSALIYPTQIISKKELGRLQAEQVQSLPEDLPNFDLADRSEIHQARLVPKVRGMLREVAEQYTRKKHPQPATNPTKPSIEEKMSSSLRRQFSVGKKGNPSIPPRTGSRRGVMQDCLREEANEDDAEEANQEEEEEDVDDKYCCNRSRAPSSGNVANIFYCYKCQVIYCLQCWKEQMPHRKQKPGHDKIDFAVAKVIEDTLDVDLSEREQAQLHLLDEAASWFGAVSSDDNVVFKDFGGYASLMADHSFEKRKRAYPALVSFVGDTGAGKSSLIKLLVSIKSSQTLQTGDPSPETPVVGNKDASTPTSGDVHLYADPETFGGDQPLLYADCEGLRGGTREPIGAKRRRKPHTTKEPKVRTRSSERHVRRRYETNERNILWATTPEKATRKYFVEHLYPRLLYTFSDVIVFVVWNARMVEDVFEQLLIWADAVIESASNQPALPHAVIVFNASDNTSDELWDTEASTAALMEDIKQAIVKNPKLVSFATKWKKRGYDISSVEQLLLVYYSSVRVVRIPKKDQPKRVHEQIKSLYTVILDAATQSHVVKHKKRLKLNAESLQPYLQRAFDHFCRDLDDPFDFIKASFANKDIPHDFSGNILKLAIQIMKYWHGQIDGAILFRELSFFIASCIMLDAVRNHKLGTASAIFTEYIDHLDETLDHFCEKIWPCEFVTEKGRCVNVKAGHAKGHQLGRGQIIAGEYLSGFSVEIHRHRFLQHVFANLSELLSRLTADGLGEREIAARVHEEYILANFYQHVGGAQHFVSHSACLSCLVLPAEHCLPCGHVLCASCIKDFGAPRSQNSVEMKYCPLHKAETLDLRQMIQLKPEDAGVRVLCLDGGGVRGVLMLQMLRQIERHLGGMPIVSFFDLAIGTSTGGMIGLGLVEMGWSVKTCLKRFEELVEKAFQKHRLLHFEVLEFAFAGIRNGRYKTEPLEDLLTQQYTERNLFGGLRDDSSHSPRNHIACKVGVTTTSTNGSPYLLANYNRVETDERARYNFLRAEQPGEEIKMWEAARATSAAPRIFRPFGHEASGHTFVDGGVYFNNPVEVALREQSLIWPQTTARPRLPDIVLSLGTGYCETKKSTPVIPTTASRNPFSYYKQLLKIAVDHVKSSQKSEDEYRRIRGLFAHDPGAESCFVRLNMRFPMPVCKSDAVEELEDLKAYGEEDLYQRFHKIRHIANRLIATSFYFEPIPGSMKKDFTGSMTVKGHIRCRFRPGSSELRSLGDVIRTRIREAAKQRDGARHSPCFVIEDKSRPDAAEQLVLSEAVMDKMTGQGQLSFSQITIGVSNSIVESDIYLRFGAEDDFADHNSISGFPRCWSDQRPMPTASDARFTRNRGWQTSTRRYAEWTAPKSKMKPVLGQYAKSQNIGLASDEQIVAIVCRLTPPSGSKISLLGSDDEKTATDNASTSTSTRPASHSSEQKSGLGLVVVPGHHELDDGRRKPLYELP